MMLNGFASVWFCLVLLHDAGRNSRNTSSTDGIVWRMATSFVFGSIFSRLSGSRPMRPEEGTYLAHRQGNPLLGLLPREHADFGLRREHRGLHGDDVRMRGDIVGQDQYGRLAIAHEIARHREDEVGVG